LSKIDPVCAVIVSATVVDAERVPEVPVIVTVIGLDVAAAEEPAESVSPRVPVGELGAIAAVTLLGRPLAESVTPPEKPAWSVTVTLIVALLPWATDTDAGDADRVKPGIVYVTVATALLVKPLATAIASIVSVDETVIEPVYTVEAIVGGVPLVV
jgi:hypothetical protein